MEARKVSFPERIHWAAVVPVENPAQRAILTVIAEAVDANSLECRRPKETIAWRVGCCRATLYEHINRLEELYLLYSKPYGGKSTLWWLEAKKIRAFIDKREEPAATSETEVEMPQNETSEAKQTPEGIPEFRQHDVQNLERDVQNLERDVQNPNTTQVSNRSKNKSLTQVTPEGAQNASSGAPSKDFLTSLTRRGLGKTFSLDRPPEISEEEIQTEAKKYLAKMKILVEELGSEEVTLSSAARTIRHAEQSGDKRTYRIVKRALELWQAETTQAETTIPS